MPLLSWAVSPATTTVEPTRPIAWVACVVCCRAISVVSCWFMLICCSTCANWTSCWVNWLVSSGSSGFWFLSCVVRSRRKVSKLPARVLRSTACDTGDAVPAVVAAVTEGVIGGMALVAGMVWSADADIDAAAAAKEPAVAGRYHVDRREVGIGDHEPRRVVIAAGLMTARKTLVAQGKLQAVVGGLQPRLLQRPFELA